jgi:hypothetical protein
MSSTNKSNQTIADRIERLRKIALEQANAIIRENKELYKEHYIKNKKQPKISPEIIVDQFYKNFDLRKDKINIEQTARVFFENIRSVSRLELALMSQYFAEDLPTIDYKEKILNFYWLGYLRAYLTFTDVEKMPFNLFADLLHSVQSSGYRKDGHERIAKKLDETLEPLLEQADQWWAEGDKLPHHKMAKYLLKDLDTFANLPDKIWKLKPLRSRKGRTNELTKEEKLNHAIKIVRDKLKPIAKKHGRLFGIKGVKVVD